MHAIKTPEGDRKLEADQILESLLIFRAFSPVQEANIKAREKGVREHKAVYLCTGLLGFS